VARRPGGVVSLVCGRVNDVGWKGPADVGQAYGAGPGVHTARLLTDNMGDLKDLVAA